jgi:serine/threonine protein kinase
VLERIVEGKVNLPDGVDAAAVDLIRRMLEPDVSRRITLTDIAKHPFLSLRNSVSNGDDSVRDDFVQVSTASWPTSTARSASLIAPWGGSTRSGGGGGGAGPASASSSPRRRNEDGVFAASKEAEDGVGYHGNERRIAATQRHDTSPARSSVAVTPPPVVPMAPTVATSATLPPPPQQPTVAPAPARLVNTMGLKPAVYTVRSTRFEVTASGTFRIELAAPLDNLDSNTAQGTDSVQSVCEVSKQRERKRKTNGLQSFNHIFV